MTGRVTERRKEVCMKCALYRDKIEQHIKKFDAIMREPASYRRGQKLAAIIIELQNVIK